MSEPVHRGLVRQLRRLGLSTENPPDIQGYQQLLAVISQSYADADADRYTLERSIEVSSEEMRALHDVLSHRAMHDALTGLPNRAALCALLDDELVAPGRRGELALLFIDLDGFKRVNDSLGHAAGDELLVRVAERIRSAIRNDDTVSRLGGDEFVVCCRRVSDRATVLEIAGRVVDAVEQPFRIAGNDALVGASIGISYTGPAEDDEADELTSEELLRRADLAMYQAKAAGRSRFVVFDDAMGRRALDRVHTEQALRRALLRDQFILHYQPILDPISQRVLAQEALVRWQRPGYGLLPPDEFIPIAEQSRLITQIDAWVLKRACADAAARFDDSVGVSVNISARDLPHQDLVEAITAALQFSGLRPSRLTLELTESSLMSDNQAVTTNLARIESLGVRLAIDDFGTGYSSLSYLNRLSTRVIKIDRSFIGRIGDDPAAAAVVGAIITMAHALHRTVVAEGVETAGQADQLITLGVDAVQGFLFARPQPLPPAIPQTRPA